MTASPEVEEVWAAGRGQEEPRTAPARASALERDAPLFILFNPRSGSRDASAARDTMRGTLSAAGRAHLFVPVRDPAQLLRVAERTVELALRSGGAVVAAGGDGTVNALAQLAVPQGCPFGIVPQGTFNYTPRANGIPLDVEQATLALLDARIRPVNVGLVNDRVFLVNASLGLYPQLLEDREAFKQRYGRYRSIAVLAGLYTLFHEHRQLNLEIEHDHEREVVQTPTLFVGNNPLQLEQAGIEEADVIEQRQLAGVLLRPVSTATLLGLALLGALGRLGSAEEVRHFPFRRMTVRSARGASNRRVKVATDGEISFLRFPLEFRVSPKPLLLLGPAPAEAR